LKRLFTILACLLPLSCLTVRAQQGIIMCTDSTFCVPAVYGMPRGKGLSIKQERVMNYRIASDGSESGLESSEDEVKLNRRWEVKLRFPLLLKPNIKIAMGLEYFHEEYRFEGFPTNEYPFYQVLEDKPLRSLGASLYIVKPWLGKRYLILRVGANFNADVDLGDMIDGDFLKLSVAPLIGWKTSPYSSMAVGIAYSYDFGRQNIYPVFSYNRTFNSRWGFESILPLNAKLRYTDSEKSLFYATAELNGAAYNIRLDDPSFPMEQDLLLRKSEIRFLVKWEREIHDWLWFGVEAGMRTNFDFSLRDGLKRDADLLIDNDFNSAVLLNLGIFIVPPRKFFE